MLYTDMILNALFHYVPALNPALVLLAIHIYVIIYFIYNFIHHYMTFQSLDKVNQAIIAWSYFKPHGVQGPRQYEAGHQHEDHPQESRSSK